MSLIERVACRVGGVPRAKVILVLAGVFALDGAELGAIGAMALPLQHGLHIGTAQVGLFLTVSLGMGAITTLPYGHLIDRRNRTRVLTWAVLAWGTLTVLSGIATSYVFLLVVRALLGAASACAAPAVASLVGDTFFPEERGRIYGYVLSGDLVGTAIGVLVSGELATWSWRAGFIVLGIPALALAWAIHRMHEPARGGTDRLPDERGPNAPPVVRDGVELAQLVRARGGEPRPALLVDGDPRERSLWWSVRYVLRVPTNLVLIIASALGYFYFAGLRTFAVEYLNQWYGASHSEAIGLVMLLGIGALTGIVLSGRIADRMIQRGHPRARIVTAILGYFGTVALLLPGLLVGQLWLAMIFFVVGGAALGGINPPLDSARLDIMLPGLWGRAGSVRAVLRKAGEAAAPFAFGVLAETVFGDRAVAGSGLHVTFLVLLGVLVLGGLVALIALETYVRDVATADANAARTPP